MSDHEDVLRRQADAERAHFGCGGSRTLADAIDAVLAEVESLRAERDRLKLELHSRSVSLSNVEDELKQAGMGCVGPTYLRVLKLRERAERLEAALRRYASALVRAGVLSRPSIGGQTVTAWKCRLCQSDQVSGSTAHGPLCDECRREVIHYGNPAPSAPEPAPAPTEQVCLCGAKGAYYGPMRDCCINCGCDRAGHDRVGHEEQP